MSMMKTLAKVAMGVAVAKGVGGLMKQTSQGSAQGGGGLGGLFGGARQANAGGGIEDMLGSLLGGRGGASGGAGGAMGGLGGLLEQITGQVASRPGSSAGGLNDMLGGLLGGAASSRVSPSPQPDFGSMLNQALAKQDEPETPPTPDQEALAALMLRAMIQAMKSDGQIDAGEQAKLMERLGDVSAEERDFVQSEMQKPVDIKGLAAEVPRGLQAQVYTMSVMGIDLDSQEEAKYLDAFAKALGLAAADVNAIHEHMGVPTLYA